MNSPGDQKPGQKKGYKKQSQIKVKMGLANDHVGIVNMKIHRFLGC